MRALRHGKAVVAQGRRGQVGHGSAFQQVLVAEAEHPAFGRWHDVEDGLPLVRCEGGKRAGVKRDLRCVADGVAREVGDGEQGEVGFGKHDIGGGGLERPD